MPTPKTVQRRANLFWKAGTYPFKDAPPYSMTEADNRRAVEEFAPCKIVCTHHGSPLDDHLGKVVKIFPATDDFASLGLEAEVPAWLDATFRDADGRPTPIPLSATWDRTTKRLKNVALVTTPRIEEALFAAFAAETGYPSPVGQPGKDEEATPDPSRQGKLVVTGERDGVMALKGLAERMGLVCELIDDTPEEQPPPPAAGETPPVPAGEAPMSKEIVARFSAEIADLKKRLAQKDQQDREHDREARFAEQLDSRKREGRHFVKWLADTLRINFYQRDAVFGEYVQAAQDDLKHPEEVHFSADGQPKKGTRVEALEARYTALPARTDLTRELVPDREGEATFESATYSAGKDVPDKKMADRMLAASSFAAQIQKSRQNLNGKAG